MEGTPFPPVPACSPPARRAPRFLYEDAAVPLDPFGHPTELAGGFPPPDDDDGPVLSKLAEVVTLAPIWPRPWQERDAELAKAAAAWDTAPPVGLDRCVCHLGGTD